MRQIFNQIGGSESPACDGELFEKLSPATGQIISRAARSQSADVQRAVATAKEAQSAWAETPPVKRGLILARMVEVLRSCKEEMAAMVAEETGKSVRDALGETEGAAQCGLFFAGEGQRMFGRTTTSGIENRWAMTIRQPVGVAGLIAAANTPIANVAWKVFPALICGNSAVFKAAEDTPGTAWLFGKLASDAGLPDGVLNIVQGLGKEAGQALVEHPDVGVVSFTGSTAVGREIAVAGGRRLAKISLELGGKNPFVVCEDADLDQAVKWALLSAFSNAGQRCASASRIIVIESAYSKFKDLFVERAKALRVGTADSDDLGPVINERQLCSMLAVVKAAKGDGASVLCGGERVGQTGFFMAPTVLEGVPRTSAAACTELFGPITALQSAKNYEEALAMANDSAYGLTACIHTANVGRSLDFVRRVQAGVAIVNAGTFGSEPHMPFGGLKQSGNGSREPGSEALDVYSNLKSVLLNG